MTSSLNKKLAPLLLFVLISLLFEGLSRGQVIPSYLLPSPSSVLLSLFEEFPVYTQALLQSGTLILASWALSFLLGSLTALLFALSPLLEAAFLPFCTFFQTIPIIAIAPLMVIWFGFGPPTVVASATIVSFFPVLANALLGLSAASQNERDLFQSLRATPLQTLLHLRIPKAIPFLFAGLRISAGLAVVGAIVGEFVGGGGLGGLIDSARTQQKTEMVFACVFLSSLVGLFLIALVRLLEIALRKYRQV